jgi:hypothetical protein
MEDGTMRVFFECLEFYFRKSASSLSRSIFTGGKRRTPTEFLLRPSALGL